MPKFRTKNSQRSNRWKLGNKLLAEAKTSSPSPPVPRDAPRCGRRARDLAFQVGLRSTPALKFLAGTGWLFALRWNVLLPISRWSSRWVHRLSTRRRISNASSSRWLPWCASVVWFHRATATGADRPFLRKWKWRQVLGNFFLWRAAAKNKAYNSEGKNLKRTLFHFKRLSSNDRLIFVNNQPGSVTDFRRGLLLSPYHHRSYHPAFPTSPNKPPARYPC